MRERRREEEGRRANRKRGNSMNKTSTSVIQYHPQLYIHIHVHVPCILNGLVLLKLFLRLATATPVEWLRAAVALFILIDTLNPVG